MRKLLLILPALLLLTACGGSKMADCEKTCGEMPSGQKEICMSTCQKAAEQFDAQGNEEGTAKGKTSAQCERFSGMAKNGCYAGLAMDEKDPSYCDNIANSAEQSDCKANAQ